MAQTCWELTVVGMHKEIILSREVPLIYQGTKSIFRQEFDDFMQWVCFNIIIETQLLITHLCSQIHNA